MSPWVTNILITAYIVPAFMLLPVVPCISDPQHAYQESLEIIRNDSTFHKEMEDCPETFLKRVALWRFILGEADDSTKYVYNWKSSELLGSFEIPDAVYESSRAIQEALIRQVLVNYCLKIADSLETAKKEAMEECPWRPEENDTGVTDSIEVTTEDSVSIFDSLVEEHQQYLKVFKGKKKLIEDTFERMPRYLTGIVSKLIEAQLSPSFALTVALESRFIDTIVSYKEAAGLYQFIKRTGRDFGLTIDSIIDERYSEYHARVAFVKYMSFLSNEYREYPFIALLSYFTGPRYYRALYIDSLDQCAIIADSLPFASSNYIPSIVALREIFLERFDELMEYPTQPDRCIKIVVPGGMNIRHLPTLFRCSEEELRARNKQFIKGFTDYILSDHYTIFVPSETALFNTSKKWYEVFTISHSPVSLPRFYASLESIYAFLAMKPHDLFLLPQTEGPYPGNRTKYPLNKNN